MREIDRKPAISFIFVIFARQNIQNANYAQKWFNTRTKTQDIKLLSIKVKNTLSVRISKFFHEEASHLIWQSPPENAAYVALGNPRTAPHVAG